MMFPSLHTSGNVAQTKFCLSLLRKQCFLVWSHVSNVSSTRNIDFPIKHAQNCKSVTNRAFESMCLTKRFPSLLTLGNMEKRLQQCFLICPGQIYIHFVIYICNYLDLRDTLIQGLVTFSCYPDCLKALEGLPSTRYEKLCTYNKQYTLNIPPQIARSFGPRPPPHPNLVPRVFLF